LADAVLGLTGAFAAAMESAATLSEAAQIFST
jgi:hypothetical protein